MPDHHPNPNLALIQTDDISPEIAAEPTPPGKDHMASIAELEAMLIHAEAKAAILAAGGNVTLLLVHVADVLKLARTGEELVVVAIHGEEEFSPSDYVVQLKEDPDYAAAFGHVVTGDADRNSGISGSGASIIPGNAQTMLDPDNPLKLGHALADIARGSVRVRF